MSSASNAHCSRIHCMLFSLMCKSYRWTHYPRVIGCFSTLLTPSVLTRRIGYRFLILLTYSYRYFIKDHWPNVPGSVIESNICGFYLPLSADLMSKVLSQAVGGRPPRYAPAPLLLPWAPKRLAPPSRRQRSSSFPRPTRSHAHRCSRLTRQHGGE